jgi:serine protease Do
MCRELFRTAVVALCLPLSLGCDAGATTSKPVPLQTRAATNADVAAGRKTAITTAVERVAPSVVTVQTEVVQNIAPDPLEEMFFGVGPRQRSTAGIGSGFIVRADGVIVTNAHVVSGASKISVALRDGTTFPATLLGQDETNDLAVIKIDAKNLPIAPLGSSDDLLVGEWAVAIGNPYGFLLGNTEPSVTVGVVSGTGRNLIGAGERGGVYVDMIQTDASINPGNSGGPLINALGEVIGVNSSLYSPSGGSVGLGFAIPIKRARRVTEDLVVHRAVRRPWIGVHMRRSRAENSRAALAAGAVVGSVTPGSPAARAGVRVGDVIAQSRGKALHNPYDWEAELLDMRVGDKIPLVIHRDGRAQTVTVTVEDQPDVTAPKIAVLQELQLATLTPAIRGEQGIVSEEGAYVVSVSDRVSQATDLLKGDVILQINRVRIRRAEDAAQALNYYAGKGAILVTFERQGQFGRSYFSVGGGS